MKNHHIFKQVASICVAAIFMLTSVIPVGGLYAQSVANLPVPGSMVVTSPGFTPTMLRGIRIHPDNPLKFTFLLEEGDAQFKGEEELKAETEKLIKHFLASLAVKEEDLWVNLSPYEENRIIPEAFGQTEMGRDLLAQDYLLKQLTASLIYPEDELGKKFWDRVYQKAQKLYGTTKIPVNTFNKVWIVPEKVSIYETSDTAFIVESRLDVLMEEDFLALDQNLNGDTLPTDRLGTHTVKEINNLSSQVIKEIILPEIKKEVNEGKNFALLRQIYNSLALAVWYKKNLRESFLNQVYANQEKVKGVDVQDKAIKQKIYDQYVEAYRKGVYHYIKEDYDAVAQRVIPRKYFSGGLELGEIEQAFRYVDIGTSLTATHQLEGSTRGVEVDVAFLDQDRAMITSPTSSNGEVVFPTTGVFDPSTAPERPRRVRAASLDQTEPIVGARLLTQTAPSSEFVSQTGVQRYVEDFPMERLEKAAQELKSRYGSLVQIPFPSQSAVTVNDAPTAGPEKRVNPQTRKEAVLEGAIVSHGFVFEKVLGAAGQGKVLQVYDQENDRRFALKVILNPSEKALENFEKEVKLLNQKEFLPKTVDGRDRLIAFGKGDNYFAMTLLPGQSLSQWMENGENRVLELDTIYELIKLIALELVDTHAKGIVHRDLKPANVMIDEERKTISLIDFGVATPRDGSTTDVMTGTLMFMAPEQISGRSYFASDMYSLGVLIYQLAVGTLPFEETNNAAKMFNEKDGLNETHSAFHHPDFRKLPEDLQFLVKSLLNPRSQERPEAMEVALQFLDEKVLAEAESLLRRDSSENPRVLPEGVFAVQSDSVRMRLQTLLANLKNLEIDKVKNFILRFTASDQRTKVKMQYLPEVDAPHAQEKRQDRRREDEDPWAFALRLLGGAYASLQERTGTRGSLPNYYEAMSQASADAAMLIEAVPEDSGITTLPPGFEDELAEALGALEDSGAARDVEIPELGSMQIFGDGFDGVGFHQAFQVFKSEGMKEETVYKDYELIGRLGEGGFAVVYQVRRRSTGEVFAVKVFRPGMEKMIGEDVDRLGKVARSKSSIAKNGFPQILSTDGSEYYAMSFLEGVTFDEFLLANPDLSEEVKIGIFSELAWLLHELHVNMGLIHKDIKPANVLVETRVSTNGRTSHRVKILDLGVASNFGEKKTAEEDLFGSVYYIPPEATGEASILPTWDLYSLGVLAFELFTGIRMFSEMKDFTEIIKAKLNDNYILGLSMNENFRTLSDSVKRVILKLLAKDVSARYQMGMDAALDLLDLQDSQRVLDIVLNASSSELKRELMTKHTSALSRIVVNRENIAAGEQVRRLLNDLQSLTLKQLIEIQRGYVLLDERTSDYDHWMIGLRLLEGLIALRQPVKRSTEKEDELAPFGDEELPQLDLDEDSALLNTPNPEGGIKLDPKFMQMKVQKEGDGVQMRFDPALLSDMQIEGAVPIIQNIITIPAQQIPVMFLGETTGSPDEALEISSLPEN